MRLLFLYLILTSLSFPLHSATKVLSLNLHGYHPMGEKPRYTTSKGKSEILPSHLFYFRESELLRGKSLRAQMLANIIENMDVDFVLLQEVGAGSPSQDKSCVDFYKKDNSPWQNTAQEISSLTTRFHSALACRGNLGWITDSHTFENLTISASTKNSKVVFKKGDNPYPRGILIEGFAILYKKPIVLLENKIVKLQYNFKGDSVSFQQSRFLKDQKEITILNVHLGHKLQHFEQAVAIRRYLQNLNPEHLIVGGDFNAREDINIEASMIPWYIKNDDYDFSLNNLNQGSLAILESLLMQTNYSNYKPWATISSVDEARTRIDKVTKEFFEFSINIPIVLTEVASASSCKDQKTLMSTCRLDDRIDFIFASGREVKSYFFVGQKYYWSELDFYSDHPAIYGEFIF